MLVEHFPHNLPQRTRQKRRRQSKSTAPVFHPDLVHVLLKWASIKTACSLALVCKKWNYQISHAFYFWERHARSIGNHAVRGHEARHFCIVVSLNGFNGTNMRHLNFLRNRLDLDPFRTVLTWILSCFLRRQVVYIHVQHRPLLVKAYTKVECAADFYFAAPGFVFWKLGKNTLWEPTSETRLVEMYQTWFEKCL